MIRRLPSPAWRLRPVGATPNDAHAARVLQLAETNAALTAGIVLCVAVLNNVHHALH
jgi:hypothetical protein